MTAGIIDGSLMRLELEDEKLIHATSCSLSLSAETRETSSKDIQGNYTAAEVGKLSWTASCEGLYSQDDEIDSVARADVEQLFDYFAARQKITMKMTTGVTGDIEYSGEVIITSVEFSHPDGENGTYSIQLQGSGPITKTAVA
ncbi:MAG: phage tail tube protein [Bacteroidota bacterium]